MMMNSLDMIRNQMGRIAQQKEAARQNAHAGNKKKSILEPYKRLGEQGDTQQFLSLEGKMLEMFHGGGSIVNQLNIAKFIKLEVPSLKSVLLLRMTEKGNGFRLYVRDFEALQVYESYRTSDFQCVDEIITAKTPTLHNDGSKKKLNILCQWKPLFGYIPDLVLGIPITLVNSSVGGVVALAFNKKLPKGLIEKKLIFLQEQLGDIVPYALNNQGIVDNNNTISNYHRVLDSIRRIERVIGGISPTVALTQIGTELTQLAGSKGIVMFTIDEGDNLLRKFHTTFGNKGNFKCPDKHIHQMVDIPIGDPTIVELTWAASNKRGMKINAPSDLLEFGIHAKHVHSIGNCNAKSMLIFPVVDYCAENSLVIELSDKARVFTPREFEMVSLLCQHASCLLTSTLLLDRRERNIRRKNVINEVLCSIDVVKPETVEQAIKQHHRASTLFHGHFDEFDLSIRLFPEADVAAVAFQLFYELDIVRDFKIKRSVLVRFVLSLQQGYGPMHYHNWYHAVSVAHFTYLLVKKLRLVDLGHFTKLEAFALVVSGLAHDIDHRGTNNQFQSYTNSEIYKLYACEDSVMERHHLSIGLAILHREDCNILESFSDPDYKYFVELLTWNIIATDISKHLKTRTQLFIEANSVNPRQRKMARLSLFMTAADLCDNCKSWDDNLGTVRSILQEFFEQGDMERRLGFTPIAMMDRRVANIPLIEYKFTKYIVTPVYVFLANQYEIMAPCVANIKNNENLWTLATMVFESVKDRDMDPLDILNLPGLKESALKKLRPEVTETIDDMKKRKFSMPPPPSLPSSTKISERASTAPTATKPSVATTKSETAPPPGGLEAGEEVLEEVDTGEKRGSICSCFTSCCKKRNKRLTS